VEKRGLGEKKNREKAMQEKYAQVIDGISELIRYHLNALSNECYHPAIGDPDKMDDSLKLHRSSIETLREIRSKLEGTMVGL